MNSKNCLSEDRHDHGISGIRSRKLHVVGEFVWRDALEHELAGIRVFAFVALDRNPQEPNSDCEDEAENDYRQDAPPKTQRFSVDIDPMCHERCSSDGAGRLATEGFLLDCVFSKWRLI